MPVRRISPFAALALLACTPTPEREQNGAEQPPAAAKQAEPERAPTPAEPEHAYAAFDMPDPGEPWSVPQYSQAHKAIGRIVKQDPKLLPRVGSAIFTAIVDLDHLGLLAAGSSPEHVAGLSIALAMIHMAYGDQLRTDPGFNHEYMLLTAALIRVTTRLPTSVVASEAEAEALRAEPSRLGGLLKFRHGVHELVASMLADEPGGAAPSTHGCEALALVIDDAAPLLLANERAGARERIAACTGASAEAIAKLEQALADETPTAALVTALLPEHREFATAQATKTK